MESDTPIDHQIPLELKRLIQSIASWTRFIGIVLLLMGLVALFGWSTAMKLSGLHAQLVVNLIGVALLFLAAFKLSSYSARLKRCLRTGTLASFLIAMKAHRSFWKHWFFYSLASVIGTVIKMVNADW